MSMLKRTRMRSARPSRVIPDGYGPSDVPSRPAAPAGSRRVPSADVQRNRRTRSASADARRRTNTAATVMPLKSVQPPNDVERRLDALHINSPIRKETNSGDQNNLVETRRGHRQREMINSIGTHTKVEALALLDAYEVSGEGSVLSDREGRHDGEPPSLVPLSMTSKKKMRSRRNVIPDDVLFADYNMEGPSSESNAEMGEEWPPCEPVAVKKSKVNAPVWNCESIRLTSAYDMTEDESDDEREWRVDHAIALPPDKNKSDERVRRVRPDKPTQCTSSVGSPRSLGRTLLELEEETRKDTRSQPRRRLQQGSDETNKLRSRSVDPVERHYEFPIASALLAAYEAKGVEDDYDFGDGREQEGTSNHNNQCRIEVKAAAAAASTCSSTKNLTLSATRSLGSSSGSLWSRSSRPKAAVSGVSSSRKGPAMPRSPASSATNKKMAVDKDGFPYNKIDLVNTLSRQQSKEPTRPTKNVGAARVQLRKHSVAAPRATKSVGFHDSSSTILDSSSSIEGDRSLSFHGERLLVTGGGEDHTLVLEDPFSLLSPDDSTSRSTASSKQVSFLTPCS